MKIYSAIRFDKSFARDGIPTLQNMLMQPAFGSHLFGGLGLQGSGFFILFTGMPNHAISRIAQRLALVVALLAAASYTAPADPADMPPFKPVRIDGKITVDGKIDEPAWEKISPLPLATYEPIHLAPPTEMTEIRIGYDDHYLYISGRLYDSNPSGIRANSMYRDRYAGDDVLSVLIDTFNDNENALWFFTNPTGVRFDIAITRDGEGGSSQGPPGNLSWNTYWDTATTITDEGWFAEMRIPFSSLGFQDSDGHVEMGMVVYRYIARKNERQTFPKLPATYRDGYRKPSLMQDVVLEGVYSQKPVYVTPYAAGGLGQEAVLDDTETSYETDNEFSREVGLDVKVNVTSNLTLDLTANTDFAQVEADDQQVNLTRYSLFFPEKRQFFQERAGMFEFQTGRVDRLFYTRRIGLNDGVPARILGGTRLTGRMGRWDLGLINMQTARSGSPEEEVPSENFGVVRLRRQVLNPYSYAGGMVTSRLGEDGAYNIAYGLDGLLRVVGNDYLTLQWAQTLDDDIISDHGFDFLRSALVRTEYERRTELGWNYGASLSWLGPDYDPEMGFVRRLSIASASARLSYGKLMPAASPVRLRRISLFSTSSVRTDDRELDSGYIGIYSTWEFKSGAGLTLVPRITYENLPEALELPFDNSVPEGSYLFPNLEMRYESSRGRLLQLESEFEVGGFYDGWQATGSLGPTWIASRFVELGSEYELSLVDMPKRDASFQAHIVRFRGQLALNTKVSASAFVQYSNVAALTLANLRLRYNFAEGNDFWLVYNQGWHADRYREIPLLPASSGRTALIKYTYTLDV